MSGDLESVGQAIIEAANAALGRGVVLVRSRAKQHAPVRSIFAGTPQGEDSGYLRELSIGEVMAARKANIRAGLPGNSGPPLTTEHAPAFWKARRISNVQKMLAMGFVDKRDTSDEPNPYWLSRRGASEVRSMRALHSTKGRLTIGGRLRDEIYSTRPSLAGNRSEAWVISPTEYAKYQEFGTRHNRPHSYLRRAAEESREEVIGLIADAISKATRAEIIEIVVRI